MAKQTGLQFRSVSFRDMPSTPAASLICELLRLGYSVRFQANGGSMHPTIREGEVITVRPLKPSDVKVGDIILYRNDGLLLAHRVVKMQNHDRQVVFILRGDAAGSCGDPVELQQMLGKVTAVERNGRKISLDGRTPKLFWMVRRNVSGIKRWFSQKATLIGLRHPRCVRIRSKGERITGSAPDGLPWTV